MNQIMQMKPSETKVKDDPKPEVQARSGLQALASISSTKQSMEKRQTGLSALTSLIMPAPSSLKEINGSLKSKQIDVKVDKNANSVKNNGLASLLGKRQSSHSTEKLE